MDTAGSLRRLRPISDSRYRLVQLAGPVTPEVRRSLAGLPFVTPLVYVPNDAFVVRLERPGAEASLRRHPRVRYVGPWSDPMKIAPELARLDVRPPVHAVRPCGSSIWIGTKDRFTRFEHGVVKESVPVSMIGGELAADAGPTGLVYATGDQLLRASDGTRIGQILEGQTRPGPFKSVLQDIVEDVSAGTPLSEAMAKHPKVFDRLYTSMVRAGEAGGVLDKVLQRQAIFRSLKLSLLI